MPKSTPEISSTTWTVLQYFPARPRSICMDCSQQTAEYAYGGVPATVPGVVEAEEFDNGGQGVGYSDTTDGNTGGVGGSLLDNEEIRIG